MPSDIDRDTLFARPHNMIVDFEFDAQVASVFSDMIRRSVPGYGTLVALTGLLAEQYVQPHSQVYDLGCSLGAITLSLQHRLRHADCRIIAVDNSPAMVERCKVNLADGQGNATVDVVCADILDQPIQNASVVVVNLTMQFVDPTQRLQLLQKIHSGMLSGAVLIVSEKTLFDSAAEQQFQEGMHVAFKKANAYSDLEISRKRSALEKVLIPDSVETHVQRLREAGFSTVYQWFQCFNFVSLLALK